MSIYFDHAATTPMSEAGLQAMVEQVGKLGNASSLHSPGRSVRKDVEEARELLSRLVGAAPSEIIFTGSGTEANNLVIKGTFWTRKQEDSRRNVVVISAFEHHAILDPVEWMQEHQGAEIIYIPITAAGYVDLEALREIIATRRDEIALIAVMHSNNEVGTIQPIAEVVNIAGDIPVHSDAVQSFTKVDFSFAQLGLTSATISAHKIGGPLGVAALILRRGIDITPILHGGGQERDIRSGTLNAPGIVAFAAAAQDAISHRSETQIRVRELKNLLVKLVQEVLPDVTVNGSVGPSLPGIVNLTFPGTESDGLLLLLDAEGIFCSTGSACSAGVPRPSHVLLAMGLSERTARSSLRFSLGASSTEAEVQFLASAIPAVVTRARAALVRG
ncbi:MAG: cysteine desulfurase family protein [Actinomycetes bacterium]|jgi:cysteine desulfurase